MTNNMNLKELYLALLEYEQKASHYANFADFYDSYPEEERHFVMKILDCCKDLSITF